MYFDKQVLILFFLMHFFGFSQEKTTIQYVDPQIEELIEITTKKTTKTTITTYSIQLKASESPEIIKKIKNKYKSLFPSEIIDELFEPPYFKIIIGTYLDKKKAEKKLKQIQKKFKSAFVLKRELEIGEFKKRENTH